MAEDRVWRIWRTDTHHKVILSRRLWETEAVHGRAAAIANGITHSSRMNCGSRTVAVAGEDRKDSMVLCARQRLFRLGSEHGQARRYLCLTTQGRPIADTRGNPGLLPRHAVRYGIVTYGLLYGPLFHRTNCKTSLKHFPDMQQYTSSSDREISNHVCPVPPHKSSAAPWPRLAQASGASPTRVLLVGISCRTTKVQVYISALYLVVYTYTQVRSVAWVRCVCQQPLSLPHRRS